MVRTFPLGGGHIPHRKNATEHKPIMTLPAPKRVVIPLSQHIGAPCRPIVQVGDTVKLGQKIGEAEQYISAPIHASVSGKVVEIGEMELFDGSKSNCIVIENDGLDQTEPELKRDYTGLTPKQLVEIIRKPEL